MKKLLILLLAPVLASCSSDIVVKSDLGETSVVKESAVTVQKLDPDSARRQAEKAIEIWSEGFSAWECRNKRFESTRDLCWKAHNENIVPREEDLEIIANVPPMKIIKYRTIYTNVNGDKSATDYDHVACIPEGTSEERRSWGRIGTEYGPEGTKHNLVTDGSVGSGVRREVCKKYG